ncbi:EAL domain-containing protein [Rheinheimera muenzenbergensis]|uniref:EAL domain-containing protein n=1 Tax=Rheinheimera muenzenbergensis TaxID=1193628 RepID=A0ABU8CAE9_9GAMM
MSLSSSVKPQALQLLPAIALVLVLQTTIAILLLALAWPIIWSVIIHIATAILSIGAIVMLLQRQQRIQSDELGAVNKALTELEGQLEHHGDRRFATAERLQQLQAKILQLHKRDAEVRHLVRVQGLIDHELAIGNRVFFESKLQHYLEDGTEFEEGAVYIIQLSHPEPGRAGVKQLQRLRGCVDILNALAADYTETVLARLSENDLVFMVSGITGRDVDKLGDRMATLLSRAACFADCIELDVLHIGYAPYQRGQTSYQILSEADMALRTAQLQGPNAAHGFIQQQDKSLAKGSVWWRSELNRALQEQRFSLSFQPVFSWQDGDVLQHEVLIRLQSSDGQQIPAAVFLPMAFNCGLAGQIDQHVLLKAARLCAADYRHQSRCSVNISVHALLDAQWWQWLEQMLLSGQLEAQQFALEVAEHHLIKNFKKLRAKLHKLHKAGFALIVDQVGLVIDNAVYADELPLESVKLHPSVVRNIDQHLEQQLFVRGLVAGYAGKGVRVIASGVELESEWLTLQKLGIAGGQGFYFSQPLNQIIAQGQLQ